MTDWTFLTDHAHVLVLLARDPRIDVPRLAADVGLSVERVATVLDDLERSGYIRRERRDGGTLTVIDRTRPLRHPVERHHPVGRLLHAVQSPADVLRDRLDIGG